MACEATWGESDGFMLSPKQCFLMSYRIHVPRCHGANVATRLLKGAEHVGHG